MCGQKMPQWLGMHLRPLTGRVNIMSLNLSLLYRWRDFFFLLPYYKRRPWIYFFGLEQDRKSKRRKVRRCWGKLFYFIDLIRISSLFKLALFVHLKQTKSIPFLVSKHLIYLWCSRRDHAASIVNRNVYKVNFSL